MAVEIEFNEIAAGVDPHVELHFAKNDIPAKLTVTLHFEGDWSNLYDDVDESEDAARDAVAADVLQWITQRFAV